MAEQTATGDAADPATAPKTPFTIVTGFLGAGKTTLINYILTEQRDKRICVIENEFGEINIDEKLVSENMASKEDLIQMDNGCACCSIRGDLVRTLGGLVEKRLQFDAVMLETTGLAKGLVVTLDCESASKGSALLASGKATADYKTDMFTCKASYDYYKGAASAALSTVYSGLVCGGSAEIGRASCRERV